MAAGQRLAGVLAGTSGVVAMALSMLTVSCTQQHQHHRHLSSPKPVMRFGVISDIQYCDKDDAYNFARTTIRHYRETLEVLRRAVGYWNREQVNGILQLGDIIDGACAQQGASDTALRSVLDLFDMSNCQNIIHCIGNHELYNFDRRTLQKRLNTAPPPRGVEYYSTSPGPGWRVVVLDPYQEAIIGWEKHSPPWEAAVTTLSHHNPNDVFISTDWFEGLEQGKRRFVPFNGAYAADQLAWLRGELDDAESQGDKVIVLSHVLLHPKAGSETTLAWDHEEALSIVQSSSSTVAVLCGHDHNGGYVRDDQGIHHITFRSPLNKGTRGHCYGILEVYNDRFELRAPAMDDLVPVERITDKSHQGKEVLISAEGHGSGRGSDGSEGDEIVQLFLRSEQKTPKPKAPVRQLKKADL